MCIEDVEGGFEINVDMQHARYIQDKFVYSCTERPNGRQKPGLREGCVPYVLFPNVLHPNRSQIAFIRSTLGLHTTIFVDCEHTL